ncbi:MAG TPA: transcription elongation factor GreA [Gaiellaceae bacterium]|nr:transcription elongation factor GreA [Gaiellaceae bacterium]
MSESLITKDGFERLSDELEQLKSRGRLLVADRLRQAAASDANWAENADYADARQEQVGLERRIASLEQRLHSARIVEPCLGNGRVDVGERVRVRDLSSDQPLEVELVGPLEADLAAGRVSVASPLGQALVGLHDGEIADVDAPRGRLRYEVLAIELPGRAA